MTHIRLVKLSSRRGRPKALGDGYMVLGHTERLPAVGEVFRVLRYSRNGVRILGVLTTSTVESVRETNRSTVFKTLNSTYRLTVLAPVARKSVEKN